MRHKGPFIPVLNHRIYDSLSAISDLRVLQDYEVLLQSIWYIGLAILFIHAFLVRVKSIQEQLLFQ